MQCDGPADSVHVCSGVFSPTPTESSGRRFQLHTVSKQPMAGLLCAGLACLTGCATNAELEDLRAEIARANDIALRAQADLAQTRLELAALKAQAKPVAAPASPAVKSEPPAEVFPPTPGYKWGAYRP